LITIAVFACSALAANSNRYNDGRYNPALNDPYYNSRYYKNRNFYENRRYYDNFYKRYNPAVLAPEARIVQEDNSPSVDGTYSYSYETENGIHGEERGYPVRINSVQQTEQVEGSYSFITPEGVRVGVRYTADENGFHPIITCMLYPRWNVEGLYVLIMLFYLFVDDGPNAALYANQPASADVQLTRVN